MRRLWTGKCGTSKLFLYRHSDWSRSGVKYPFTGRLHCACGANYQRSCAQSRFTVDLRQGRQSKLLCEAEGVFEDELVEG
jgi:hypothetical protein